MKITTFDPIIVTSKAGDVIELFEELGFRQTHHNQEVEDRSSTRMEDENGFHVDVVQNDEAPQAHALIRMNVDDFDEAHAILASHGFKDAPRLHDVRSAKAMGMVAPSGFTIGLVEHKRNHD